METSKMVFGIDIAYKDFKVCCKTIEKEKVIIKGSKTFCNTPKGFDDFYSWSKKRTKQKKNTSFIMEATGIYYENLAYYLYDQGCKVVVVLPNKIKNFAKSLNIKTKTDSEDAKVIAQYGIERNADIWAPVSKSYKNIRDINRELLTAQKEKTRLSNQLHALQNAYNINKEIIVLKMKMIQHFDALIDRFKTLLKQEVEKDKVLAQRIETVCTIKGAGFYTVTGIIAETNGFKLINSISQLISYVGLDVVQNQSGLYKGRSSISKKGNAKIRKMLFMPTLACVVHNKPIKEIRDRVNQRNPNHKIKGIVAGMRKLLILIYTLWKKMSPSMKTINGQPIRYREI